jgi:hypothetical protein
VPGDRRIDVTATGTGRNTSSHRALCGSSSITPPCHQTCDPTMTQAGHFGPGLARAATRRARSPRRRSWSTAAFPVLK